MADITFTDADGKTISLETYLENLEKKEKKIRDEIKSVEYNKEAKVPILKTKKAKNGTVVKDKVIKTKFYDSEGKEMADETRYVQAKKIALANILKAQDQWKTTLDYATGAPYDLENRKERNLARLAVTDLCNYFVSENMMVKKMNPEGKGYVFKFIAQVTNISQEFDPIYQRYLDHYKALKREKNIKGKKKDPKETPKEVPVKQEFGPTELTKVIEPITQKVNVDLNFNIHVFFSWGK